MKNEIDRNPIGERITSYGGAWEDAAARERPWNNEGAKEEKGRGRGWDGGDSSGETIEEEKGKNFSILEYSSFGGRRWGLPLLICELTAAFLGLISRQPSLFQSSSSYPSKNNIAIADNFCFLSVFGSVQR